MLTANPSQPSPQRRPVDQFATNYLAKPDTESLTALLRKQARMQSETFYDRKANVLFRRLARNGTWQTPTLAAILFASASNSSSRLEQAR